MARQDAMSELWGLRAVCGTRNSFLKRISDMCYGRRSINGEYVSGAYGSGMGGLWTRRRAMPARCLLTVCVVYTADIRCVCDICTSYATEYGRELTDTIDSPACLHSVAEGRVLMRAEDIRTG